MKMLSSLLRILGIILLVLLVLAVVILVAGKAVLPKTGIPVSDLAPISLDGVTRLLILSRLIAMTKRLVQAV